MASPRTPRSGPVRSTAGGSRQLSLIVLADQTSDDDTFTGRALSGEAGQRFQGVLRAAGLTKRYLIIRTLPVDTLDLTPAKRLTLVDQPKVQALHRELLSRVRSANAGVTALLAMGPGARRLAPNVVPAGLDVIELAGHGEAGFQASWQAALTQLSGRAYTKDLANPTFAPRRHGASCRGRICRMARRVGSAPRATAPSAPGTTTLGKPSPDYLKLFLPSWVASLAAAPLTPAEQAAADQLP